MSPRKKRILQIIVSQGPQSERGLRRLGPFNPTPLRKSLAELVEEGCIRRDQKDEKGWRLRPGNPQFYHATSEGVKLVFPSWKWMDSAWRATFVHPDSHKDLGVVPSLMDDIGEAQASRNIAEAKLVHRDLDILDLQDQLRRIRERERERTTSLSRSDANRKAKPRGHPAIWHAHLRPPSIGTK